MIKKKGKGEGGEYKRKRKKRDENLMRETKKMIIGIGMTNLS